jgi:hypothetical protein
MLILTSIIGSVVPDLDLFIGQHRKTLHYPVYSGFIFIVTIPLLFVLPITGIYINSFILCFGLHSVLDAIGGGLGKYPWKEQNLPTVYDHYSQKWLYKNNFKYRVEYDGSPLDLLISILLAMFIFVATDTPYIRKTVLLSLLIAFVYTIIRKKIVKIEDSLSEYPVLNKYIDSLHGSKIKENDE